MITVRDKKVRRPVDAAHPFVEKTTICVELDWTSLMVAVMRKGVVDGYTTPQKMGIAHDNAILLACEFLAAAGAAR